MKFKLAQGTVLTGAAQGIGPALAMELAQRADRQADKFIREVKATPQAASRIVDGIERRSPRILIGPDASVIDWLSRLAPVGYWRVLKKIFEAADKPQPPARASPNEKGI